MRPLKNIGNSNLWPIIPAVIITLFNIDWVVIPLLRSLGISIFKLLGIVYILSTVELKFWFWFWSWVAQILFQTRKVRESIEFGKEIGMELKEKGYADHVKDFLFKIIEGALDEKNKIVRFIKWGGSLSLIMIGASPESGSRVVGIIVCKMFGWKKGFYPLALGNLIHVTYMIVGWKYLGLFRMVILSLITLILIYVIRKILTKK